MTDEEHQARAMLMGMIYHHGNGEPFYYRKDVDGSPVVASFIDANTLEPFITDDTGVLIPMNPSSLVYTFRGNKL